MHWRTFLAYNAAGGIVWAIVYGLIGYFAGHFFQNNFAQVESIASTSSWIGAAIIVVVAIIIYIIFRIRRIRRLHTTAPAKITDQ